MDFAMLIESLGALVVRAIESVSVHTELLTLHYPMFQIMGGNASYV